MPKPRSAPRHGDSIPDPQGEFPLAATEYFFYLVFQASRRRDLHFDRLLAPLGISLPRWRMLAIIRRIPDCTMSELSLYSGVDRTTLTRAIDRMVGDGLVERWAPARDRRKVSLALSDAGETVYASAMEILLQENRAMGELLDPEAVRVAARLLRQVVGMVTDERLADDLVNFGREEP